MSGLVYASHCILPASRLCCLCLWRSSSASASAVSFACDTPGSAGLHVGRWLCPFQGASWPCLSPTRGICSALRCWLWEPALFGSSILVVKGCGQIVSFFAMKALLHLQLKHTMLGTGTADGTLQTFLEWFAAQNSDRHAGFCGDAVALHAPKACSQALRCAKRGIQQGGLTLDVKQVVQRSVVKFLCDAQGTWPCAIRMGEGVRCRPGRIEVVTWVHSIAFNSNCFYSLKRSVHKRAWGMC